MLHNDTSLFEQIILRVSDDTGIEASIIEKDYYVTLFPQSVLCRNRENSPQAVRPMGIW